MQTLNGTPGGNPKEEPEAPGAKPVAAEKVEETPEEKLDIYQRLARALEESESLTELEANCFLIEESGKYQMLPAEMKNKLKMHADSLKTKFRQVETQHQQ